VRQLPTYVQQHSDLPYTILNDLNVTQDLIDDLMYKTGL
jgi:hypothetical protein